MRYLLAQRQVWALAEWARGPALFAFDFDGTLAPIVVDRDRARLRAVTAHRLGRLCAVAPCAVISGRATSDVRARLGGARVQFVVGNHGAAYGDATRSRALTARVLRTVGRRLAGQAGIDIEDAGLSLAVHYRSAPQPDDARAAIEAAVGDLAGDMRIVPGKMVLNLVPATAPHKGNALAGVLQQAGLGSALYVGDDATDEDVFRSGGPHDLITVRVGRSRASAAGFYLRDQREIDTLLAVLVRARVMPAPRHGRR